MNAKYTTPEFHEMETMELASPSSEKRALDAWEQRLHVEEMANGYHLVDFSGVDISSEKDLNQFFDDLPIESLVCFGDSPAEDKFWSIEEARTMALAALNGNTEALEVLPEENGMREAIEDVQQSESKRPGRRLLAVLSSGLYR